MGAANRMSSEERRGAILDAAVRLFAERGFRGTTTRALADAVGVTEPVLYEHFKSKRDLYSAIVSAKTKEGLEKGQARVGPSVAAKDDRGVFTELGLFILERYALDPDYTRLLLYVALEDRELTRLFTCNHTVALQMLSDYVRQRIEDGAFRRVDPAIAARTFLGMISQQGLWALLHNDEEVRRKGDEIVAGMVDIFLEGISISKGRK